MLTPAFEVQFLDGPTSPDLPARLYDASIQFRYLRKLCTNWGMDIAITPGWHGDFEPNDGQIFRLPARAILASLVVAVGFAVSGDLGLVASASNFAAFIGFAAVHASIIVLRRRMPGLPRPFRIPGSVRGVPVVSVVAVVVVLFLLANLEWEALAIGGGLLVTGVGAAWLLALWRPAKESGVTDGCQGIR